MKFWFVHGWAFDPSIWRALVPLLEGHEAQFADRGYFAARVFQPPEEDAVWITHSLGAMLALDSLTPACRALVAINGFDRFCEGDGSAGVAPRVLDRMIRQFDAQPDKVTNDFRARCGDGGAFPPLRAESLREDLLALRQMDRRAVAGSLPVPLLSLQGGRDPILPQAMRDTTLRSAPNARHAEHPDGGHLLLLEQPEWCAARIADFLKDAL